MNKVSVLIPIYNVGPYLKEALNSIINQTYKNLEIIIVDDFSTDNSLEIAYDFQKLDSRIVIIENSQNQGIVFSLNLAFNNSTGNFICRMDGDDISELDRIEKKMNYMLANNLDLVGCSVISINQEGKFIKRKFMSNNSNFIKYTLKHKSPVLHIWLSKRLVYQKLNLYRNIPYCEDYDFILRAIKNNFKIANMSEYYGYKVRFREGNTFSTNFFLQRYFHEFSYTSFKSNKFNFYEKNDIELKKIIIKPGIFENYSLKLFKKIMSKKIRILYIFHILFIFILSSTIRKYLIDVILVNFYAIVFCKYK